MGQVADVAKMLNMIAKEINSTISKDVNDYIQNKRVERKQTTLSFKKK